MGVEEAPSITTAPTLHPAAAVPEGRVGPTPAGAHVTLRPALLPFACWRVDDVRFAFDSSIVGPTLAPGLAALAALIDASTVDGRRPPASIFGHADPTGGDDYNRVLSGRRARAIYALLARRVDLWEALFSHPHGGDDWTKGGALPLMLGHLGFGADEAERRRFQAESGLPVDGALGPASREVLFRRYMDALCPVTLAPTDFLGRGADPAGKADHQGCGELNLALVLSTAEASSAARDAENAPNRRVMVFLFRPGTSVDPARWPCPRSSEDGAACGKRLWSDGAQRRAPGPARRTFAATQDTFACRFYQRLADTSPCEGVLPALRLRLYDEAGRYVERAPYRLVAGADARAGLADARGVLVERFAALPESVHLEWGASATARPGPDDALPWTTEVRPGIDPLDDSLERARDRLANLGYRLQPSLQENVLAFQVDVQARFGLELTGVLDPPTRAALRAVHTGCPDQVRS